MYSLSKYWVEEAELLYILITSLNKVCVATSMIIYKPGIMESCVQWSLYPEMLTTQETGKFSFDDLVHNLEAWSESPGSDHPSPAQGNMGKARI